MGSLLKDLPNSKQERRGGNSSAPRGSTVRFAPQFVPEAVNGLQDQSGDRRESEGRNGFESYSDSSENRKEEKTNIPQAPQAPQAPHPGTHGKNETDARNQELDE